MQRSGLSVASLKWGMFKPQCLAENRAKCGFSYYLYIAGFADIFNEANYPVEPSIEASFCS
jgi:hypothetical protein